MVQLPEAALHPNWSLTPAVNGRTKGEAPPLCVCVCPQFHVFSLSGTDGEGKEDKPIRNSIKNTSRTSAEMGGKKMDMIIRFLVISFVVSVSVSITG